MNSGVPCVGPRDGGTVDVMRHDQHGMFFVSHDAKSAGEATKHVLDNRARLAKDCKSWANQFSWERSMDALQSFYQRIIPGADWLSKDRCTEIVEELEHSNKWSYDFRVKLFVFVIIYVIFFGVLTRGQRFFVYHVVDVYCPFNVHEVWSNVTASLSY